ncbi:MAG: iron uptake porin [Thermosynechococcaceae cyanobacterium]
MLNTLWKSVLFSPALIGLMLIAPSGAMANEAPGENEAPGNFEVIDTGSSEVSELETSNIESSIEPNLDITSIDTLESAQSDGLGQVTSVSQLSDVRPTDWAFQALQSLVERYGCIAGYPNGTFRGNRSATRYEMAAALNACLDQISDRFASKADLDAVKALQDEFAAELATLRGRVDGLESRVATVESQQFSTTTKLKGEAIFGAGYIFDDDVALDSINGASTDTDNVGEDRVFLTNRVRLNLHTSFTGKDELKIRLQASNVPNLSSGGIAGVEPSRLAFDGDTGNAFELDELNYSFQPFDKFTAKVSIVGGSYQDDVETFNPYLASSGSGALSRFFRFNPITYRSLGDTVFSGVYEANDKLTLAVAASANDADLAVAGSEGEGGLFGGGEFGVFAQVGYSPTKNLRLGLNYSRSEYRGTGTDITRGTADSPTNQTALFPSSDTSEPFGNLDTTTDNFGVNIDAQITKGIHFSGWAGLTLARSQDASAIAGVSNSQVTLLNWAANLIFPDLFIEGNRGSISFGQPPFIVDGGQIGIDDGTSPTFLTEAQYQFKVSKNIAVTPGVIIVINPNSTASNQPIFIPIVRTTFKF